MFKKILPSDISVRPFKVYKNWSFDDTSSDIDVLIAENLSNISEEKSISNNLEFNKKSIWGQLHAQFYNGKEYDPFLRVGYINKAYTEAEINKDRFLNNAAKVISIPQKYVGEGIKKESVNFIESNITYADDGNGNIVRTGGTVIIINSINILSNSICEFTFEDINGDSYNATADSFFIDLQNDLFVITYDSIEYTLELVYFDLNDGEMLLVSVPFLAQDVLFKKVGNVFYEQGLIVFTRDVDGFLTSNWEINFKSTQTIYEHEYLLSTNENEFNVSTNPTAVQEVGKVEEEWETIDETNQNFKSYKVKVQPYVGTKYIKKLSYSETGNPIDYRYASKLTSSFSGEPLAYAGFEHYDLSGSFDITGSFLAPYITTIGLYDDDCNLLAVAKLPQPIKSIPDLNINFLVRFDT